MAEKNPFPGENNTGHVWDDNLRELRNPPPRWWMIAFWASVFWWAVYGIIYPMWPSLSGYTKGFTGWTQMQEYKDGLQEVAQVRKQYEDKLVNMTAAQILADANLKQYVQASAKVLFGDYCAACHGNGGQGNLGYPILADDDWLYGGTIDTIVASITNGRQGLMPAQGKMLSTQELDQLAKYVVGLSEGKSDPAGQALYTNKGCIACHGPDAKGMQAMGSANMTDRIWRFRAAPGETQLENVRHTIAHGVNDATDPQTRQAQMPLFGGRLNKDAINKLAVYVHELGGGQSKAK